MTTIKTFEDIEVWKLARVLSHEIYQKTLEGRFSRDWALKDQLNRSTGSVQDNIAEGFERNGTKEFIHFLTLSKGSAGEVRSQLYRAYDREYITLPEFEDLKSKALTISRMLSAFIAYLLKTKNKGYKFS